ncbi:MAG TPA: hypothetical protein VHQ86_05155 [Candidatus Saccharimonadia bacterium]|nr:hypothetical protein [Candidatus Saccharimonadia bacterium]
MGMFSINYIIVRPGGLLWTGDGWTNDPLEAIRIHDKRSAEKIVRIFFKEDADVEIIEDE